jgi:peptide chain release factor 3
LLYFSGAIREAGTVKGKKTGKFATSDWMKVEQEYNNFSVSVVLPASG